MKNFLASILIAYITVLSVMPCIDGKDAGHGYEKQYSMAGNSHHHELDLCSPFCTCNCCSSPTVSSEILHYTCLTFFVRSLVPVIISPAVYPPLNHIWQPPKQA